MSFLTEKKTLIRNEENTNKNYGSLENFPFGPFSFTAITKGEGSK